MICILFASVQCHGIERRETASNPIDSLLYTTSMFSPVMKGLGWALNGPLVLTELWCMKCASLTTRRSSGRVGAFPIKRIELLGEAARYCRLSSGPPRWLGAKAGG